LTQSNSPLIRYPALTRDNVREHMRFSLWKYLMCAALIFGLVNMSSAIVTNRVAPDQRVAVVLVGRPTPNVAFGNLRDRLTAALPEQKRVELLSLTLEPIMTDLSPGQYDVNAVLAHPNNGQLSMGMAGRIPYADVFLLPVDIYNHYAELGVLVDLGPALADGTLPAWAAEEAAYGKDDGAPAITGIRADRLGRLRREGICLPENTVLCIALSSQNRANALTALAFVLNDCRE